MAMERAAGGHMEERGREGGGRVAVSGGNDGGEMGDCANAKRAFVSAFPEYYYVLLPPGALGRKELDGYY